MSRVFHKRLLVAVATLLTASAAQARWLHTALEDPFEGNMHMAMTSDFITTAAFRCRSADDLALIFVVPQKPDDETTALLEKTTAVLGVHLLVIVDRDQKVDLNASADQTPDRGNYRLTADGPEIATLAKAAARATRRFAIAAEILGRVYFSKSFNVDGSTAAIGALLKGCDIKEQNEHELPSGSSGVDDIEPNPDAGK